MSRTCLAAVALALATAFVSSSSAFAAAPTPGALELPGKRTATSNTYLNADGSYTTEVSPQPINYRDAAGDWQAIDTTLVKASDPNYAVQNAAGPFRAMFKDSAGDAFLRFDVGNASYQLGLQGASKHAVRTAGPSITYADAVPGADLGYRVVGNGIKETLTLANAHGPASFKFLLSGAGDLSAAVRADGSLAFTARGAGKPAFVLSSPWAADTANGRVVHAGETHPTLSVHELGNGRHEITLSVDKQWLASSARTFPVIVDPTITINASQDAEFETSCANAPCQTRDDDPMSIGGDDSSTYAVGVQFDLTAIPSGATVTSSTLGLHFNGTCAWMSAYRFNCPPSAQTIDAHRMTAPWSEGSVTTQTPPSGIAYDSAVISAATLPAGSAAGWLSWDVTNTTQAWLSGTQPNNGLLLKHAPEATGTGAPSFESSEDAASVQPRLDVTYSGGTAPPPGPTYAQTVQADSPIAYWKLGDLNTVTAADSSGFNRPGDYAGSFTQGRTGLLAHPTDTAVLFNNASYDGRVTTQYLYGLADSKVSAETWVNYPGATGVDQLVSRGYSANGGWALLLTRTNGLQQAQFTVVKSGVKYTATANVTPGTLHLVGTYDGAAVRLYVNGTLAATRTLASAPLTATATAMLAGTLVDNVTLDETAVYDTALSAAQVQTHYGAGLK
ncbi:MAG: hypothetical protein QOI82_884 [Actinomycetota bacterium]|nr:hypothetical protein [Actinomycetota bacterium]